MNLYEKLKYKAPLKEFIQKDAIKADRLESALISKTFWNELTISEFMDLKEAYKPDGTYDLIILLDIFNN